MKLLMITRKVDAADSRVGFVVGWVNALAKNLDTLYVLCWQPSKTDQLNANVELINIAQGGMLKKIFSLGKSINRIKKQIDGIFCHMNPEYAILARVYYFGRIVSWYTHKAISWRRYLMELVSSRIITASAQSFRLPLFEKRVHVLGHGIDVAIFKPSGKADHEGMVLATIGRISPTKDYESMIKAVAMLRREGVEKINLHIFGTPSLDTDQTYQGRLHAMVDVMKLSSAIQFPGSINHIDVPHVLQHADVFINLSNTGSLDKAVLEAMACECIVLTSNEAFADILPPELLVEKNNPKALAEKIKWVMGLPSEQRETYQKQLRKIVVEYHNLDVLAKKIVEQFN